VKWVGTCGCWVSTPRSSCARPPSVKAMRSVSDVSERGP
jgi:hypothetical protein